jgi:hypothetical protein
MDKVQKPINSECYTPSSEPIRIYNREISWRLQPSRLLYLIIKRYRLFLSWIGSVVGNETMIMGDELGGVLERSGFGYCLSDLHRGTGKNHDTCQSNITGLRGENLIRNSPNTKQEM